MVVTVFRLLSGFGVGTIVMGELVPWVIKSELQLVFWGMVCLMSGKNEGSEQNHSVGRW